MPDTRSRKMTAEDLYRLQLITDCQISPDGGAVAYTVQRVDKKAEKRYTNLWIVNASGGAAKQFTQGDHSDTGPRWSPDGGTIAFLSNRGKDSDRPQIYLIPTDGGEAKRLTDLKGEFEALRWTPDGKRLVCLFRKTDAEVLEREEDEDKKKLGTVSRRYDRVFFKLDGEGYLPKEHYQLWTIDARSGKGTQITDGPYDVEGFDITPDGLRIAFTSNRSGPDPGLDFENYSLYTVPIDGGEMTRIEAPFGEKAYASFSPDGSMVAYVGLEGRGGWGRNQRLYVVPVDGSAPAKDLTGQYDVNVSDSTLNDLGGSTQMKPVWSPDGSRIYFQVAYHGNSELRSIRPDGSDMRIEIGGPGVVGAFTFDCNFRRIAHFHGDMTNPGQLFVRNVSDGAVDGAAKKLTRVNENWLGRIDLGTMEEMWYDAADGSMKLQGWILHPPGFDISKKYPSVLEIHGGPHLQYGNLFMHEFYYLAALGYVVYFTNPRGGQGYGEAHANAIENGWGTVDYDDVMKWAEVVAERPYIDSDRRGVTGGSYGGYMTNWIIGHTDQFGAAVTQRSVSNLISMYGSSDFNWGFQREFGDETPWDNVENYWRQSPMAYIGNAKTPTLVIHSERDFRCDIEQGEQVYVALKKLGVDTEFVRFPDEPHGLSRGGRTDRRIERLKAISGWFDRYLKSEK